MIEIHTHRHHGEAVYVVDDDSQEVAVVRLPKTATLAEVVAELQKAVPFVAMVAAFTAEEG